MCLRVICHIQHACCAEDEREVVDGWDMVQRPSVWHPDASLPLLAHASAGEDHAPLTLILNVSHRQK